MNVFDYLTLIIGIALIVVVLLQQGDDDIQDAFSGEKSELFKNRKVRGFDLFMLRATTVLSVLLVVFILLSNVWHANNL
ncbi:preprotein translocase subunit SecG [Haploplasma axanthum]|uniref:Protein-export membrane protein SecG n=1 Tax=Haploplasma axanthum TaxID=29552 RepID=A0A449BEY3_HAPAX|nr:preprotein translocase subunit SecG [Haploplasma axanthum]VEU81009.1 preprotein translocase subunit SecG [Haploplasma axanthum]